MRREDLARAVAEAATEVPGVVSLDPGHPVEVATYFAGGKVTGVRLGDPVEVHIRVDQVPIPPIADAVAEAVRRVLVAAGEPGGVQVVVADLASVAIERRAG